MGDKFLSTLDSTALYIWFIVVALLFQRQSHIVQNGFELDNMLQKEDLIPDPPVHLSAGLTGMYCNTGPNITTSVKMWINKKYKL